MDPKTVEEIFKRLDAIGNKMLEGGVKLSEVMVKGAIAEAAGAAVIAAMAAGIGITAFKIAKKGANWQYENNDTDVAAAIIGGFATIVSAVVFAFHIHFAVVTAVSPEWYVLKTLFAR